MSDEIFNDKLLISLLCEQYEANDSALTPDTISIAELCNLDFPSRIATILHKTTNLLQLDSWIDICSVLYEKSSHGSELICFDENKFLLSLCEGRSLSYCDAIYAVICKLISNYGSSERMFICKNSILDANAILSCEHNEFLHTEIDWITTKSIKERIYLRLNEGLKQIKHSANTHNANVIHCHNKLSCIILAAQIISTYCDLLNSEAIDRANKVAFGINCDNVAIALGAEIASKLCNNIKTIKTMKRNFENTPQDYMAEYYDEYGYIVDIDTAKILREIDEYNYADVDLFVIIAVESPLLNIIEMCEVITEFLPKSEKQALKLLIEDAAIDVPDIINSIL